MYRSTTDILFNAVLLVFWFKIWTRPDDRDTFFNPYLAGFDRLASAVMRFLEPVFFGASRRTVAAASLLLLLAFRAMLFMGTTAPKGNGWGVFFAFPYLPGNERVLGYMILSVLSFAIFLFNLWALSLIYMYVRTKAGGDSDHPTVALDRLSAPFSGIRRDSQPLALLAYGIILAVALDVGASAVDHSTFLATWRAGEVIHASVKPLISSLIAMVDMLYIITELIVMLIITSLIASLTRSHSTVSFCRDWLGMLLGPLRKRRIMVGSFDLLPLIFVVVTRSLIYPRIREVLTILYKSLQ